MAYQDYLFEPHTRPCNLMTFNHQFRAGTPLNCNRIRAVCVYQSDSTCSYLADWLPSRSRHQLRSKSELILDCTVTDEQFRWLKETIGQGEWRIEWKTIESENDAIESNRTESSYITSGDEILAQCESKSVFEFRQLSAVAINCPC